MAGDDRDEDFGTGVGECERVVVLGKPVAVVSEAVGELREFDGRKESVAWRCALHDGRLVEDRESQGHGARVYSAGRTCYPRRHARMTREPI